MHKMLNGIRVEITNDKEIILKEKWRLAEIEKGKSLYISQRQNEYPSIPDQLDLIFEDQKNKTNIWFDLISSIKEKYPKPI